jgi:hypothetical protein
MIIDAAGERSEQGRFLSKRPGSSNAVLGCTVLGRQHMDQAKLAIKHGFEEEFAGLPDR